jgi:hypothetical protein
MVQFLRTLRDFLNFFNFLNDMRLPFGVQGRQGGQGLDFEIGLGVYGTLVFLPV